MKNKKLFAILTLVCFMFTLMPVAAFAAPADQAVIAKDQPTKDSITTTVDTFKTFAVEGNSTTKYFFWAEDEDGTVVELTDGSATEQAIAFDAVGTYYVYAVDNGAGTALTPAATATKAEVVAWFKDRHENKIVGEPMEVKVKKSSTQYVLSVNAVTTKVTANDNLENYLAATTTPAAITIVADNGWTNEGEVEVFLKKADTTPVKAQELTFSTNSSYVDVTVEDDVTNRNGKVVFNVTASRAGEYKVYVNHPNAEKLTLVVYAEETGLANIKTVAQPAGNVALDTDFYYARTGAGYTGAAFELTSVDGTIMKGALNPADYKISIVEAPEDSTLDADDLELVYDATTNYAYVLKDANDSETAKFDAEGKYVIKVTLKNGKSATATVNVKEFDEPARMILTYNENTVAYGGIVGLKAVTYLDANGTAMAITHEDYGTYGSVDFAANGKAVKDVFEAAVTMVDGVPYQAGSILTYGAAEDGDEYVGTTITAIAVNDELELSATATITVVNAAEGLKYQSTVADIAVNNKLIVNPVDENGNVVAAMSTSTSTPSVYVLSAPANAAYSAEAEVTDSDELTVTFTASANGEYKLQTVVRTGDAYLTSVDTIVVGGTTSEFKDVVVMSIGANNVVVNSDVKAIPAAPMIKDARTFVPFRALAEAFGAEVEWVEATQSVVAELNGVKVVMVIGENAYTVDGVAKTADVAPFINGASTMVPVRFVAEAFGINVTPIYAENGAVADVLFAK